VTKLPVRAPRAKSSVSSASLDPLEQSASEPFRALAALGFNAPARMPTPETSLQDLLLYALTYRSGPRPDLDMVLVVAAELEALSMFIEGPLHVTLGTASRRLRVAVDLAHRLASATTAQEAG
jgi:hypothetical protein